MHYYQFHISDYKSHTSHLDPIEDIVYRRLLDWYYLNEKQIPLNPKDAARLINMKSNHREVDLILREFFTETDDGWINKRADKEITVYKGFSDAGKRGAAKRWSKGGDSPPITPTIATNNHEPLTNNHEPVISKRKKIIPLPQDFQIQDAHFVIAQERGIDVYAELEKMRDWSLSGNNKKADWDATFRNWLRNAKVAPKNWAEEQQRQRNLLVGRIENATTFLD